MLTLISFVFFTALVGVVTFFLVRGKETNTNEGYFIPIFSVVLIGMLDKRVPSWAANLALLCGFAMIAAGYFLFGEVLADWNVHEFYFLGIVFLVLVHWDGSRGSRCSARSVRRHELRRRCSADSNGSLAVGNARWRRSGDCDYGDLPILRDFVVNPFFHPIG